MEKYDLHVHTNYSRCSAINPTLLLKIAKKKGLDGIAITDHDTFKGAKIVSKLNKDKNFEVIKGTEFTTDKAHLIGLYLQDEIRSKDFLDILDKIKAQDGIAVIAHPCSSLRSTIKQDMDQIKNKVYIETYNGRSFPFENTKSLNLAKKYNIAQTAGSDAHFPAEIGRGMTLFNGNLRTALNKKETIIKGNPTLNLIAPTLSIFRKLR